MFSGTCTPINDIHAPPYTGSMHLAFIMIIQQLPMLICFQKMAIWQSPMLIPFLKMAIWQSPMLIPF